MPNKITLGLIQKSCGWDRDKNLSETLELIRESAARGAMIIFLQELFNSRYFCQEMDEKYFAWAESIPGPVTKQMQALAEELQVVLLVPMFEKRAAGLYHNSIAVIDADGSLAGKYRKMHIPDDPLFYEKYYFTPGDNDYPVFKTRYANIGTLICWDQWYPEAARISVLKGADLLFYPTAIGTLPEEDAGTGKEFLQAWQTIQRSHAIANGCYVVSVNRCGQEGELNFWGHSFVSGPFGQLLDEAGTEESTLLVNIDLDKIDEQRRVWPFFRDRRIDSYSGILKRYIDDE